MMCSFLLRSVVGDLVVDREVLLPQLRHRGAPDIVPELLVPHDPHGSGVVLVDALAVDDQPHLLEADVVHAVRQVRSLMSLGL